MRTALVMLLVAIGATAAVADTAAATPAFSFYEYLLGEWEVLRGTADPAQSSQHVEQVVRGHYVFEKQNNTMNLIGRYYDNDTSTGEITNEYAVTVEFDTPTTGAFKTHGAAPAATGTAGAEDEEEGGSSAGALLFRFEFEQHTGNGVALSFGTWAGAPNTFYQFSVSSWDRFLITLFPAAPAPAPAPAPAAKSAGASGSAPAAAPLTLFVGRKIPANVAKTFWQQYGTMLTLGGFFLFNFFVQKKAKGYQAQMQQQRRRASASGAGAAKSGATIEEVPEDAPATAASSKKKA